MKPALSQVSSLPSPFDQDVEHYAAGGCRAIDVWITKLETYLRQHSPAELRQLLDQFQMELPVASFQGGILASQGEARGVAWESFEQRLALCQELRIGAMVVACDVPHPLVDLDMERVQASLKSAAKLAEAAHVRIAVEFQALSALGNNLQTAATLIDQAGSPFVGLCFDAFHYYVGPSKPDDLAYLSRDNLFHVQLCDLSDVPRELASDRDRILPGDGDIPLLPIVRRLAEIGYDRHIAVETFNPRLWQIPPRHFSEVALAALDRLLANHS